MEEEQINYSQGVDEYTIKLRDIEQKQRILKDRIFLIGDNLIETKDKNNEKIIEIKKDIELLKQELERVRKFLETISEEFSKFATKDDFEILSKQVKIFQSLKLE